MKKQTKRLVLVLLLAVQFCCLAVLAACNKNDFTLRPLPEAVDGQIFTYDEMDDNSGTRLYTLRFTGGNDYILNADGGDGIIARGQVTVNTAGDELTFADGNRRIKAPYNAAANKITADFENKNMTFDADKESPEYVYLSYIGAFSGAAGGKEAMLYLERFYEFFLYCDGVLTQGTYEITQNSTVEFTTAEGETFNGTVYRGSLNSAFDLPTTRITVNVNTSGGIVNAVEFGYYAAPATKTFAASHGMSDYYLHIMKADTFVIYGSDGLVKALGTLEKENGAGAAQYFVRNFVDNAERTVAFTYDATTYSFPNTTPLLPASGNIQADTGRGLYFTAGQPLHFIQVSDVDATVAENVPFTFTGVVEIGASPLSGVKVFLDGEEKTSTGPDGHFSVPSVPGGAYVHFEKEGYQFSFYYVTHTTGSLAVSGKALSAPLAVHVPDSGGLRQAMPSVGVAKPLVVLVDFPDYPRPRFVTAQGVRDGLFNIANPSSLSAFYYKSSYGQLRIEGAVLDWYRATGRRSEYTNDKTVMQEVLNYHIANGLDLGDYDADGDGSVDSLFVIWAGAPASSPWTGAYRSTWSGSPAAWSKRITGYIFVPGSTVWTAVPPLRCNTVSLTHETGHLLGLNDYYSYDNADNIMSTNGNAYSGGAAEGGLGTMDMMDSNLGDHNAFSKWLLGWIEPKVVEFENLSSLDYAADIFNLRPITEAPDALFIKLKSAGDLYTEMFVIEVISRKNNGAALGRLSGTVVRILHVEATLAPSGARGNWRGYGFKHDNSYTNIKFISVMEADGLDRILNFHSAYNNDKPNYETQNYFLAGREITPDTYPNTNAYDIYGNATVFTGLKIMIEDIDGVGAVVKLGYRPTESDVLKLISVSPDRYVTPLVTNNFAYFAMIQANTDTFEFTFNKPVSFAPGKSAADIVVFGDFAYITQGWTAGIGGDTLTVTFAGDLKERCGYKIILPHGLLCETGNAENVNVNLISGFATTGIFRPVTGMSFNLFSASAVTDRIGQTFTLAGRLTVTPSNATVKTVSWNSSDPSVATVNDAGFVEVVGYGTAVITASATDGSGLSAVFTVTANAAAPAADAVRGFYIGNFSMGGGSMTFMLELRADGTYQIRRYSASFDGPAGSIMEQGAYSLSGNVLTLNPIDGETRTLAYNPTAANPTLTGNVPAGTGMLNLELTKFIVWAWGN